MKVNLLSALKNLEESTLSRLQRMERENEANLRHKKFEKNIGVSKHNILTFYVIYLRK